MATLTTNDLLLPALFAPFGLALLAVPFERALGRWSARLLAALVAGLFVAFLTFVPGVTDGEVYTASLGWAPALDLAFTLRLDGLALLFALLITGIGALVLYYGGDYLSSTAARGRFFLFLLLFLGSMLGIVLSDNLVALFVFWELTSITSFMLIGFEHTRQSARDAAQQALIVTGMGGLALLAGLVLLGIHGGAWEVSALAEPGAIDSESAMVLAAFWCVAAGAFTKSAQFPFHSWLPAAMAAPTPVSAYLHSATMVKAGVFLLARMHPVLGDVAAWGWALPIVGGVTMVVTAVIAIHQTDLKRILAYSTVSALGTMTFLIGLGTPFAMKAVIVFILAHALYKAALFMVAGTIDHETGTRDRTVLGGLRHAMPVTAVAAVLAGISMAGLPPAAGFLAKETLFAAAVEEPLIVLLAGAVLITGALTLVAVAMVVAGPFFGPVRETPRHGHEGTPGLWFPPVLLAVLGIIGGLLTPLGASVLTPPVESVYGAAVDVSLSFWHGVDVVLILSIVAISAGIAGYWQLAMVQRLLPVARANGDAAFHGYLEGLGFVAVVHTRLIQNGSLRRYIAIVMLALAAAGLGMLLWQDGFATPAYESVGLEVFAVAALLMVTSIAAAVTRSRLRAVAFVGAAGFGIALLFVLFSAPDIAMTQVLVDILIVVLFVAVFRHLPTTARSIPSRLIRLRDAAIAVAAGVTMTALTWTVLTVDRSQDVSTYFMESAYPLGQGRNVVNTILVDFRALDTLGEIVVLAVAAVGIIAVLRLRPEDDAPANQSSGIETGETS
jgi:multicomponent Na+:H+ antiporter subunit A